MLHYTAALFPAASIGRPAPWSLWVFIQAGEMLRRRRPRSLPLHGHAVASTPS